MNAPDIKKMTIEEKLQLIEEWHEDFRKRRNKS
jgi:hypothetical protein